MLARIQSVPLHIRFSWLFPCFLLVTAWALLISDPAGNRAALATSTLFDMTVTTAFLVWWFTPRQQRKWRAQWGQMLRGVALTALLFPEVRQYLALELVGLVFSAYYFGRGWRTPLPTGYAELDDLERVYAYFERFSPRPQLVRALLFDVMLFSHLLVRPHLPTGQHFGTRHGASTGTTFTLLAFMSVVEGLLVHVLVERWSLPAAWVLSGLTALGMLWMLAYGRALATRPVTVSHRRLYLRSGLHWTASTPLANLAGACAYNAETDQDASKIAIDVKPNVTLTFTQPVRLLGLYWFEKETSKIALHVDDARGFLAALPNTLSAAESQRKS